MAARASDYAAIHKDFTAPISTRIDCGRKCAPLNGGMPVCCSTEHAIPTIARTEAQHLKAFKHVWQPFKPFDATSRQIVEELHDSCVALECKIAPYCQRDARTLACRSFPFFPYFTKDETLAGIAYYWTFEDRCWVLSNLWCVEATFIRELIDAYEFLFSRDDDERQAFIDQSASARRVFSRWNRPLPVLGRDGAVLKVLPKANGRIVPAKIEDFPAHGPYASDAAYAEAVEEAGGQL